SQQSDMGLFVRGRDESLDHSGSYNRGHISPPVSPSARALGSNNIPHSSSQDSNLGAYSRGGDLLERSGTPTHIYHGDLSPLDVGSSIGRTIVVYGTPPPGAYSGYPGRWGS